MSIEKRVASEWLRQRVDNRVLASLVGMGAVPAPGTKVAGPIRWQAVFFIGPAGSGKSFVKTKRYLKHLDFKEVDPDEIKKTHPDYDPENPFAVHAWSKAVAQAELNKLMTDGTGSPVIVDGTGTDYKPVLKNMKLAEKNGYKTHLVYVYVPFEVSVWRNRNRERFVPETVIMDQSKKIANNYKVLRGIADKSKVVLNFEKPELKLAQEDIELYPVPQDVRPPRPGDPSYGVTQMVARSMEARSKILDKKYPRYRSLYDAAGSDDYAEIRRLLDDIGLGSDTARFGAIILTRGATLREVIEHEYEEYGEDYVDEIIKKIERSRYAGRNLVAKVNERDVLNGYLETILWAENAYGTDDEDTPLDDAGYNIGDFSNSSVSEAKRDIKKFIKMSGDLLEVDGVRDDGLIGHLFWLNRQGHGAGFWSDNRFSKAGKQLDKIADKMGSKFVYVGDDDQVHID
jgi:predicted ABC-type ATPase